MVASFIKSNSTILDLACGEGYLQQFLSSDCSYCGVDRVPPSSTARFTDFVALDLMEESTSRKIQKWLPRKPDYITCIAFLEHITNPGEFLIAYSSLLSQSCKLIGTTPHQRSRLIHDSLARLCLCSRHGAEEHEQFLGKGEIESIAAGSGGTLSVYQKFLFGLNQLFVIDYT